MYEDMTEEFPKREEINFDNDNNRIAHEYGLKRIEALPAHGIIQNIATEEITKKDFEGEQWNENAATAGKRLESNA